jgi:hypothetical protein
MAVIITAGLNPPPWPPPPGDCGGDGARGDDAAEELRDEEADAAWEP